MRLGSYQQSSQRHKSGLATPADFAAPPPQPEFGATFYFLCIASGFDDPEQVCFVQPSIWGLWRKASLTAL